MGSNMTFGDFALIVGILLMLIVGTYLILLLRNLNESLKVFKKLLKENHENIDSALKDAPVISKNFVEISNTAKNELMSVENAIGSLSETVEATAAAANTIRENLFGNVKVIVDFIELLIKALSKNKEKS